MVKVMVFPITIAVTIAIAIDIMIVVVIVIIIANVIVIISVIIFALIIITTTTTIILNPNMVRHNIAMKYNGQTSDEGPRGEQSLGSNGINRHLISNSTIIITRPT